MASNNSNSVILNNKGWTDLDIWHLANLSNLGIFNCAFSEIHREDYDTMPNNQNSTLYLDIDAPCMWVGNEITELKKTLNPNGTITEDDVDRYWKWSIDETNKGDVRVRSKLITPNGNIIRVFGDSDTKKSHFGVKLNPLAEGALIKIHYNNQYFLCRTKIPSPKKYSTDPLKDIIKLDIKEVYKLDGEDPVLLQDSNYLPGLYSRLARLLFNSVSEQLDSLWEDVKEETKRGKQKISYLFFEKIINVKFNYAIMYENISQNDILDPISRRYFVINTGDQIINQFKFNLSNDNYDVNLDPDRAKQVLNEIILSSKPTLNMMSNIFDNFSDNK